ncbi:MAG: YihY/virulence factor BrkB family protein [Gaiellaceae bacterium]
MRYLHALKRAFRRAFKEDDVGDSAAAITYYAFLAIPSVLLVVVGCFSLFADPATVSALLAELSTVVPADAISLLDDALTRVIENRSGGLVMVLVGLLVAAWTVSGAMGAVMRVLNRIFKQDETRGFVQQRAIGLALILLMLAALTLVFGLLVLGPHMADWVGAGWIWWVAQWPVLLAGLLLAFGVVYWLGPDRKPRRFKPLTAGALLAVLIWLASSAGFAVYVSMFGSYNKAWGSLAAVIVMLTWIWLSSFALLLGAELDADLEGLRDNRLPTMRG